MGGRQPLLSVSILHHHSSVPAGFSSANEASASMDKVLAADGLSWYPVVFTAEIVRGVRNGEFGSHVSSCLSCSSPILSFKPNIDRIEQGYLVFYGLCDA
ncbi:hypothetical protein AAG906_041197 [Vitis piasezkii]